MGGGGSKPQGGIDEDDDTFLAMLDNDVLVALLGENEDLKAFSSRFTPSSCINLTPSMAMMIVISGEVAVYLIHNEARLHVKTYCKGEILPFFLHGEAYHPTSISDDASTIFLSPSLKLLFDLKIAAPVRQRRGTNQSSPGQSTSSRSEQRTKSNSHNRALFSGKLAVLQRPDLDAFLAERPHLTALHKLCSLKLAPMFMQSHEMLITEKLYADILCPLVSLRMLLEGDLLCYPDTAAVALNLHSQHQEHDYSKQAGVLLLGSLAAFDDSSDVAEVLERLDEQHRQRGTYRGANRARRTLLGNSFSGKVQEVDWNQQGRHISPGSVVGVQNTFLHPKRTFDAVFASKHSIMGFVSPLAVEALRKVNASLISMWKVSYCSTFLAEVKASGKPILKGIGDFGIQFLAARTTLQTVMKGDVVFKEGAAPDTFYFIIDGEFEERIAGREKSRVLLTGGHYGASSIIAKIPYKGSLVAVSKATLMAIPAATFMQIISQDPKVVIEIKLRAAGLDTDLIHVLKHATGYGEFRSYLQASFCAENIHFWKAVDEWDEACEDFRASSGDPAFHSEGSTAAADPTSATAAANTSSSAAAATSLERSRSSFDSHNGSDDGKPSSRPPSSHSSQSYSRSYSSRPGGAGSISVNGVRRDSLERLPPLHTLHWPKLSALRQRCRRIIDQFCTMNSDESVNIPHALRVAIEKNFKAWAEWEAKEGEAAAAASAASGSILVLVSAPFDLSLLHIFHAAQREVYELMRKDPFSRYKTTPAFANFIRSLAEESASESRRRRGEDVERLRAYMASFVRDSPVGAMSVMRA